MNIGIILGVLMQLCMVENPNGREIERRACIVNKIHILQVSLAKLEKKLTGNKRIPKSETEVWRPR